MEMFFDLAHPNFLPRNAGHSRVCGFVKESRIKIGFCGTAESVSFAQMTVLKYRLSEYRVIYTKLFRG